MSKYCQEKFEDEKGNEKKVCWECTKHIHDPSFITVIAKKLGSKYGGTWSVRVGSYESNKSSCSPGAIDYGDL